MKATGLVTLALSALLTFATAVPDEDKPIGWEEAWGVYGGLTGVQTGPTTGFDIHGMPIIDKRTVIAAATDAASVIGSAASNIVEKASDVINQATEAIPTQLTSPATNPPGRTVVAQGGPGEQSPSGSVRSKTGILSVTGTPKTRTKKVEPTSAVISNS